jgi:hypothetical protein
MKKITAIVSGSLAFIVFTVAFLPLRAIAGLESPCTYISDLVSTNPLSSDLASTSDDHLRCIKVALKTSFPNVNAAVTATDEVLSAAASTSVANVFTAASQEIENAAWRLIFDETDAAADERLYDFAASAGQLLGRTRTDADAAGASWLVVDRTGTTVDSIALASTAITWNANTLFTTANDGAASGLDADLLDGSSSAAFAQIAAANSFTSSGAGTSRAITLTANAPVFGINESDAAADEKIWELFGATGDLTWRTRTDAEGGGATFLTVSRTGATVDSINLAATSVQYGGIEIGFRGIPQNAQTGNYPLVLADAGKHIYHAAADGAGDTYTIPANSSVAYAVGTAITFINSASDSVSIAITTDTMTLGGTTTTGTRTLAQNGVATAIKVTTTAWIITGTGLTWMIEPELIDVTGFLDAERAA